MVTVMTIGWILAAVTAILIAALLTLRVSALSPAVQDFVARTSLVAIAVLPLLILVRGSRPEWQWSLPILPPQSVAESTETNGPSTPLDKPSRSAPLHQDPNLMADAPWVRHVHDAQPESANDLPLPERKAASTIEPSPSREASARSINSSATSKPLFHAGMFFIWLAGAVWVIGSGMQIIRIWFAYQNSATLIRSSSLIDIPEVVSINHWCANQVGLRRPAELRASQRIDGPVVTGLFRSRIILPPALLQAENRRDLRAALLHESGHVRRHDVIYDLLLKMVMAIYWAHPLIYLFANDLRRLREEICDNFVLSTESPVTYSEILLRLAVGQRLTKTFFVGLGMFSRRNRLEARVDSLLSPNRSIAISAGPNIRWSVLCAIGLAAIGIMIVRLDHATTSARETQSSASTDAQVDRQENELRNDSSADAGAFEFTIVDTDGQPVKRAKVTHWGHTTQNGSLHFGFPDKDHTSALSDANGRVKIVYTKQTQPESKGRQSAGLKIEHPDHPVWSNYLQIDARAKVILPDSTTIVVHARRSNESEFAERLVPQLNDIQSSDWSQSNGELTYRRADLSDSRKSYLFRVVQVPRTGPAWFSDIVDLKHLAGNPLQLDLTLKPGVRVEGRLSNDVPRPVINGRAVGAIVDHSSNDRPEEGSHATCRWRVAAPVAEDGTFVFDSLPANGTLQMTAVCDGWVSHSPTMDQIKEFTATGGSLVAGFEGYEGPAAGTVFPQVLQLSKDVVNPVIEMDRTAGIEFTARDSSGKTLSGVQIQFVPMQIFFGFGGKPLGSGDDDLAHIRHQFETGDFANRAESSKVDQRFTAKTNSSGRATIANLPPGEFHAEISANSGYLEANSDTHYFLWDKPINPTLVAGETVHVDLPMSLRRENQQDGDSDRVAQVAPTSAEDDSTRTSQADTQIPPREFIVTIENSKGDRVVGATVIPYGIGCKGNGFSFDRKATTTTLSDSDGRATITLSKEMDSLTTHVLGHSGMEGIYTLSLLVKHPEYPDWEGNYNVGLKTSVILSDPTTILIRAHRANESSSATRLAPVLSSAYSVDWNESDGVLTCRRVNLSNGKSQWLRVAQISEQGPLWFSDPIDLKHMAGDPIEIDITLKPGIRVEGRVSDDVPRPIKNGTVIACTSNSTVEDAGYSSWSHKVEISADGTFVLESVPANSNLQVIALAEGWVSLSPTSHETKAYAAKYGFPLGLIGPATGGQLLPQHFRIEDAPINPTILMDRTVSVEVTALDLKDNPIPNVQVQFTPNQTFFNAGSSILGSGHDLTEYLRARLKSGDHEKWPDRNGTETNFSAITDAHGVAVIANLPAGGREPEAIKKTMFFAASEKYVAVPNNFLPGGLFLGEPWLLAELEEGKTTKVLVRMVDRPQSPAGKGIDLDPESRGSQTGTYPNGFTATDEVDRGEGLSPGHPKGNNRTLKARVVGADGKPIQGVKILLCGDGEGISSDANGRIEYQFDDSPFGENEPPVLPATFTKEGYASQQFNIRMDQGEQTVTMSNDTYFEGVVTDHLGIPVKGVTVRACQEGRSFDGFSSDYLWSETKTDSNGAYKLLVQPGQCIILAGNSAAAVAWLPKPRTLFRNESDSINRRNRHQVNQFMILPGEAKRTDIRLEQGVDFKARFIDRASGKPIPDVQLMNLNCPTQDDVAAKSDQTGAVTIPSIPAGEVTFSIYAPNYVRVWSENASAGWKNAVAELGGSISRMTSIHDGVTFDAEPGMDIAIIELEAGVSVSGTLLTPEGQPMSNGVVVPASRSLSKSSIYDRDCYQAYTDSKGRFELRLPPTDDREIRLIGSEGQAKDEHRKWANGVSETINLSPGELNKKLELKLTRPGMIRGRVVNKVGKPVASVEVQSSSVDLAESPTISPKTSSDRNGKFTLRYVRPGRHRLHGRLSNDVSPSDQDSIEVEAGKVTDVGDVVIPFE